MHFASGCWTLLHLQLPELCPQHRKVWHNAEYEQLMLDGIATTDTAKRQEIYAKAEHIMTREDWATTPLYNETKFYLLNPAITGFEMDATFRMFWKDADIQ